MNKWAKIGIQVATVGVTITAIYHGSLFIKKKIEQRKLKVKTKP